MLGKLIKHEWKSTYKMCCLILIALAAVTLVGCFALRIPMLIASLAEKEAGIQIGFLTFGGIISMLMYILMLLVASYGVFVYMAVHFYKSMYSDEGYLTHTLPVTTHQLLLSKWFIGAVWYLLIMLAMFLSMVILGEVGCELYVGDSLFTILAKGFEEAVRAFGIGTLVSSIAVYAALMLLSPFTSMIMIYGALTMGQLFRKHRVLMGILCYIGVLIVNSVLGSLVSIPITLGAVFSSNMNPSYLYTGTYIASLLVSVAVAVILYFVSHFILAKKFDIE